MNRYSLQRLAIISKGISILDFLSGNNMIKNNPISDPEFMKIILEFWNSKLPATPDDYCFVNLLPGYSAHDMNRNYGTFRKQINPKQPIIIDNQLVPISIHDDTLDRIHYSMLVQNCRG